MLYFYIILYHYFHRFEAIQIYVLKLAQAVEQQEPRFNHLSTSGRRRSWSQNRSQSRSQSRSRSRRRNRRRSRRSWKTTKTTTTTAMASPRRGRSRTWQSVVEKLGVKRDGLRPHVCYSFMELFSSPLAVTSCNEGFERHFLLFLISRFSNSRSADTVIFEFSTPTILVIRD